MIRVSELKLGISEDTCELKQKILKKLQISQDQLLDYKIYKQSLDARKKKQMSFVYTVDVSVKNEKALLQKKGDKNITKTPDLAYHYKKGNVKLEHPPVIIGFGPAGIFCALILAQMGLNPIVVERGESVEERTRTVEQFWKNGILNTESNVQFGEGGAGTFSDGKLTTRTKNLRCRKVLEELVESGAPEEILYSYKPHIGTDILKNVVKNIREKIISLGGQVLFSTKITDIEQKNGQITGVIINNEKKIETQNVVLCIGHSARDTFEMLLKRGVAFEQKPFAIGVRIEHTQEMINTVQYGGPGYEQKLGAADYKLTYTTKSGRAVYTFCMCPGGTVVGASSEKCALAVNGMSQHKRDGKNANSALLVQIYTEDFKNKHPLAGVDFQREIEKKAFLAGGGNYNAPVQLVGDFMKETKTEYGSVQCMKRCTQEEKTAPCEITPSYEPGVCYTDLNELFPPFISQALKEAILAFGQKLKGFDRPDAVLTAVESRSSSPVRIVRDEQGGESIAIKGIYPAGEGAGYAGGIVSAAIDGIMAAEKLFYSNQK